MCTVIKVDWEAWAQTEAKARAAVGARGFMLLTDEALSLLLEPQPPDDGGLLSPTADWPKIDDGGMLPGMNEWLAERNLR